MRKVTVIYSGSFNPLHTGHAMLASWVSQYRPEVEELWLTVTPHNPLKPRAGDVDDADRLKMASLVADSISGVKVSDFEFSLPVPSYTYSTLAAMSRRWPERRFKLLIGSDNWHIFERWKCHDRILDEFGIYIYLRPGYPVDGDTLPAGATLLEGAPQSDLSSTFVREGLRQGRDMKYFLPQAVYEYVRDKHLYAAPYNTNQDGKYR